jgi:hypothetical protein
VRPVALLQRFGPSEAYIARTAEEERVSGPLPDRFAGSYGAVKLQRPGTRLTTHYGYLAADGAFRFGALPAGRYELWLGMLIPGFYGVGDTDLGLLATVDLRGGDVQQLDLDASAWLPGRATGRFLVDGVPWRGTAGFARRIGDVVWPVMAEADASGRVTSPWLLPGTYLPFVDVGDDPARPAPPWPDYDREGRFVFGTVPVVVVSDTDTAVTADLRRRRVTVTLLDADGDPAADYTLVPEPVDHPWASHDGARTDSSGIATWDPAPPGRLRLRAIAPKQDARNAGQPEVVLGEVAADASTLTVRLPR